VRTTTSLCAAPFGCKFTGCNEIQKMQNPARCPRKCRSPVRTTTSLRRATARDQPLRPGGTVHVSKCSCGTKRRRDEETKRRSGARINRRTLEQMNSSGAQASLLGVHPSRWEPNGENAELAEGAEWAEWAEKNAACQSHVSDGIPDRIDPLDPLRETPHPPPLRVLSVSRERVRAMQARPSAAAESARTPPRA
jgi:hypothetical protein